MQFNFTEISKWRSELYSELMAQFQITREKMCIISHTFFPNVQSRKDKGQENEPKT